MKNINGIEIGLGNDGMVIWSSDWIALFDLARTGHANLNVRNGGPATFADSWVVYSEAR